MSLQNNTTLDFNDLYSRYSERLVNGITRLVNDSQKAEDIASKAFHIAFEKQGGFRGEASFYTWLFAIAKNEVRQLKRGKEMRLLDVSLENIAEVPCVSDNVLSALTKEDDHVHLAKALKRVPTIYRRLLVAHFLHGRSIREIAQSVNMPVGTVLSRIFKGKQSLRQAWKEVG